MYLLSILTSPGPRPRVAAPGAQPVHRGQVLQLGVQLPPRLQRHLLHRRGVRRARRPGQRQLRARLRLVLRLLRELRRGDAPERELPSAGHGRHGLGRGGAVLQVPGVRGQRRRVQAEAGLRELDADGAAAGQLHQRRGLRGEELSLHRGPGDDGDDNDNDDDDLRVVPV